MVYLGNCIVVMKMEDLKNKLVTGNITDDECDFLFDELIKKPILDKLPIIHLADYPQLKLLCWNCHSATMTAEEALYHYEKHWTLIDEVSLIPNELKLINTLQVDKNIYLEFHPYKTGDGKGYREKKLCKAIKLIGCFDPTPQKCKILEP